MLWSRQLTTPRSLWLLRLSRAGPGWRLPGVRRSAGTRRSWTARRGPPPGLSRGPGSAGTTSAARGSVPARLGGVPRRLLPSSLVPRSSVQSAPRPFGSHGSSRCWPQPPNPFGSNRTYVSVPASSGAAWRRSAPRRCRRQPRTRPQPAPMAWVPGRAVRTRRAGRMRAPGTSGCRTPRLSAAAARTSLG